MSRQLSDSLFLAPLTLGVVLCVTVAGSAAAQVICKQGQGCFEGRPGEATSSIFEYDPALDPDPNGILDGLIFEAEQDPRAAFDLGIRYMRGDGIRRDPYQAIRWMRDAGGRGNVQAQAALGRLYLSGLEEMGADYVEAVSWLERAAANGDRESRRLLDEASDLADDQRAFEQRLRYWRRSYTSPYWYRTRYYGYWRGGRYHYY